ncbi:pyrimidine reductase family protein [Microbacterium deminutum]|uniref:Pyrimidine reductase family protein n=1 Tax=Microbacterium deminutum TaxID=344164 RepID=A0ABN2RC29_9MICO
MPTRQELYAAYELPDRSRSRVRMNFVESADGAATLEGRSGPLGGEGDRDLMQVLRAMADVVVVGAGTVRAEGYSSVDVAGADAGWRRTKGVEPQPAFAVVSRALNLEPDAPVFAEADRPPVVVTCAGAPTAARTALEAVAEVMVCGDGDTVDLGAMLAGFAERGWTQVLCEGGPHLFGTLLDGGLVDEVCLTIAPRFVGGSAGRIARGAPESDRRFALAHALTDDEGFVFLRYVTPSPVYAAMPSASRIV